MLSRLMPAPPLTGIERSEWHMVVPLRVLPSGTAIHVRSYCRMIENRLSRFSPSDHEGAQSDIRISQGCINPVSCRETAQGHAGVRHERHGSRTASAGGQHGAAN